MGIGHFLSTGLLCVAWGVVVRTVQVGTAVALPKATELLCFNNMLFLLRVDTPCNEKVGRVC
jgi:hypothetical protein